MKKSILTIALPLAALLMQSCSEDDFQEPSRVDSGANIRFGAMLDYNPVTRTWYGGQTTDPNGQSVWPIYWNTDGSDHIFVYSPQGLTGRQQGAYTVKPKDGDKTIAADITVDTESGVQASDAATYNFYAVYPASAVKGPAVGNTITATLSAEQKVTYADINGETGVKTELTLPAKPEAGTIVYNMAPDMNSCLMIANEADVTLNEESPVTLRFKPFSSVLDITIPGPTDNNTIPDSNEGCAVTTVVIEADAPIAGDFTYDFSPGISDESRITFGDNKSNVIEITTMGEDANANLTGVPLANGNELHLQAFMLPNPAVSSIKIKVYTSDSQIWTKTLAMSNSAGDKIFIPTQIHKVRLPKLNFAEADFDYSRWISQLDPNIYLSELSLPGSCSSFSWKLGSGNSNAMQTLTALEQFKEGIRVFRGHIWLYDGTSSVDGQPGTFGINVAGNTYVRPMFEVIQILYDEIQKNHPDEFCVLMLSDYSTTASTASGNDPGIGSGVSDPNYDQFYSRFKAVTTELSARGYLPDHIDANTTIGDVKGKVIIKLQLNGNGGNTSNGSARGMDNLNGLLKKINNWTKVNDSNAFLNWWTPENGSNIFYAYMTYGITGTFDYTEFMSKYEFPSLKYYRGTVTVKTPGLASEAATQLIANTTGNNSINWESNINVTTPPTDFDDTNKMWYIYGAQSNPSNDTQYDAAYTMMQQSIAAIQTHYKTAEQGGTKHNKFFMVYLGGASSSPYTTDYMTTRFVPRWKEMTSTTDYGTNRPFGWVLFNRIPAHDAVIEEGTPDYLVKQGIQRVISRNNDLHFKLARKPRSAASPNGDSKGIANGPSLF